MLKIPTKEALRKIDALIEKGAHVRDAIVNGYNRERDDLEKAEERKENEKEKRILKIKKKLEIAKGIEVLKMQMSLLSLQAMLPSTSYIGGPDIELEGMQK